MDLSAASDPNRFVVKQPADFPNESALLVHRQADGQPEWHETQVDVVFVQSGSATLLVGRTLINGETVAPHEKRNGAIQGGVRQKVSAADLIRIPPQNASSISPRWRQGIHLHRHKGKGLLTRLLVPLQSYAGITL
jgi:hypothetical protein